MKKLFFCIVGAILIAIAAVNVNIALKSDNFLANFALSDIVSMAKNEGGDDCPEMSEVTLESACYTKEGEYRYSCDCIACMRGTSGCCPTCPCCD